MRNVHPASSPPPLKCSNIRYRFVWNLAGTMHTCAWRARHLPVWPKIALQSYKRIGSVVEWDVSILCATHQLARMIFPSSATLQSVVIVCWISVSMSQFQFFIEIDMKFCDLWRCCLFLISLLDVIILLFYGNFFHMTTYMSTVQIIFSRIYTEQTND